MPKKQPKAAATIPSMRATVLDFDILAQMPDSAIWQRMQFVLKSTGERLLPPGTKANSFIITRNADAITVQLLKAADKRAKPKPLAVFAFVPQLREN
jgi:hypothetical protein